ncbi:hypothetical protein AGMMS50268_21120 [Spirochaetia bacterium]|nr:hypothetical protein AGMMS50268_21120 [Spirochaetia bacterium]
MADIFDPDHEDDLPNRYIPGQPRETLPSAYIPKVKQPKKSFNDPDAEAAYLKKSQDRQSNQKKYGVGLTDADYEFLNAGREEMKDRYRIDVSDEEWAFINNLFPEEKNNEEYVNNRYRVATAVQLSHLYNIPLNTAFENLDTIIEATYTEQKTPKTAFKAVSDSFALGMNSMKISALGTQLRMEKEGSENRNRVWQEYQKIKVENLELADGVTRNMFLEGVKAFMESLPFTASAAGAGILGSLATPAAGIVAAGVVSATQMAGLEYMNLLDEGIDDETARTVSLMSGAIQGVIEVALGDVAALGTRTGVGQMIFKKLHYSGKIGAVARGLMARPIDMAMEGLEELAQEKVSQIGTELAKQGTERKVQDIVSGKDPLEEAAEDLATAAYQEYLRATAEPGNETNTLPRDSKEYQQDALWQSFKMGFLVSGITGVLIIPKDIHANVRDVRNLKIAADLSPDLETFKKVTDNNLTLTGMNEKTKSQVQEEIFSIADETRKMEVAAAEDEIRRTKLYGGSDTSQGEPYRDNGAPYTEQQEHTGSNGITTGSFTMGNPKKGTDNIYADAAYELTDGKIHIESVRMAENREGLQPEFLQIIANTSGQEITWEEETYSPQEGGSQAIRIGMDTPAQQNAVAVPSHANTAVLEQLSPAEKIYMSGLQKVMPNMTDDARMQALEVKKLQAGFLNMPFEEYIRGHHQEGIFSEADANILAAAQKVLGFKRGATTFDAEGKAIIYGSTKADLSTALHEDGHVFRKALTGEALTEAEQAFGVKNGNWTEANEEAFTAALVKYLETGEAPTTRLGEIFRKIKEFLGKIKQMIERSHSLTPEQKAFWDKVFREGQENQEALQDGRQGAAKATSGETDQAANGTQPGAVTSDQEGIAPEAPVQYDLYQLDMTPEDQIINNSNNSFPERAGAAADKAGKAYAAKIQESAPGNLFLTPDAERAANIEKLAAAPNLVLDGNAYLGKYELNKASIRQYLKGLREKKLENSAISEPIKIGNSGINKLLGPGLKNDVNRKLIVHIPELIKNAVFITDEKPNRQDAHYNKYSHFVTGIELDGSPYTVHIVLGENAGVWYYDQMVSKIEKGDLLSVIHLSTVGHPASSLSDIKDTTLPKILQAQIGTYNRDIFSGPEISITQTFFQDESLEAWLEHNPAVRPRLDKFLAMVDTDEGLLDMAKKFNALEMNWRNYTPDQRQAFLKVFGAKNWEVVMRDLAQGTTPRKEARERLQSQLHASPLVYMEAWSVVTGDPSFALPKLNHAPRDDSMEAFVNNAPGLVELAATFDSWETFKANYEAQNEVFNEQPDSLMEKAAKESWYKSIWEDAQKIKNGPVYGADAVIEGAETYTAEQFIELINSDAGFNDLISLLNAVDNPEYSPQSEEEQVQAEAELNVLNTTFSNPTWGFVRKNSGDPQLRHNLREMVRKNPLAYMEGYAVLSGDERWLPGETDRARLSRLDRSGNWEEAIARASPEELLRIQKQINYEGVEQDIVDGKFDMNNPRIAEHEEVLKERQKEGQKKIDKKKQDLSDYQWMIESHVQNLTRELQIGRQLQRDTTPKGITASRKQQKKIQELQKELRKLRTDFNNFIRGLDPIARRNTLDLRELVLQDWETRSEIAAIQEMREVRKRVVKAILQKADLKTVNIEQAHQIQALQSHFDKLYETIPRFLGPKAKSLRQLFSDFTTNEKYREDLAWRLNPVAYARLEKIIYLDPKAGTVRPYADITKAQRNILYGLLLDNEKLFKDLGIDDLETSERPVPADMERIMETLKDRIPADILYKLENRNLAEWNLEDMQTLAGIMSEIRKEGRDKRNITLDARKKLTRDYVKRFDEIVLKQIKKNAGGDRLPGIADTDTADKKASRLRAWYYSQMNGRRFWRMLEGGKDGLLYEVITQGEDKAFNEETRHAVQRRENVDGALKALGINTKELWSNTFTIQAEGFETATATLDEMFLFHRAALNERAFNAVVYGTFMSPDERMALKEAMSGPKPDTRWANELTNRALSRYNLAMDQLEAFLSRNEKFKKVEDIIGKDYDDNYNRLKEFVATEFNQDLGSEAYYIPLKRSDAIGDLKEGEKVNQALSDAGVGLFIAKGFTQARIDLAPWQQTSVKSGLYKTWDQMVVKQEHLMAYQPFLREMRNVFEGQDSGKLKNDIKKAFSKAGTDYVEKWISDIADSPAMKDYSGLDAMTRLVRGHYPAAVLSWRVSSFIKQAITSPPPFFQYVNPVEYLSAAVECMRKETLEMIRNKSVFMKTRMYDPAIEAVKQLEKMYIAGTAGKVESVLSSIEKIGMSGLEWIDFACVAPGWLAAYKKQVAKLTRENSTMTDELIDAEAIRYADQVVRDTQPSNRQADMAPMFKGKKSAIERIMLQFQLPMSTIFQNLTIDAPNNIKQGKVFDALVTVGIYAMTAVVIGIMAEDDDDEKLDLKNMGVNALGGLIESIPMFGGGAAYAVENFLRTGKIRPSARGWFPITDSAVRVVNALSDQKWDKAATNAADMFLYATGLPQGLKREIEKAVEAEDWTGLLILLGYH